MNIELLTREELLEELNKLENYKINILEEEQELLIKKARTEDTIQRIYKAILMMKEE